MENLFWDSCVFNAFLYEEANSYDVDSIEQYFEEAKGGEFKIYTSSIFLAEIANTKIKKAGCGGPVDFLNDFQGAITVIDASLDVMELAGRLRDIPYRKQESDKRKLTVGDAAMLATALHLNDTYGVQVHAFHTFDNGGKKREIPLLTFEQWCVGLTGKKAELAGRVARLRREKPIHPAPTMRGMPHGKKL